MPLHPRFAAFDLSKFTALAACRDSAVLVPLTLRYAEFNNDLKQVRRAVKIFEELIGGELPENPPASEDEFFQSVVAFLVEDGQRLVYSESLFWEYFYSDVSKRGGKYQGAPEELLRYLMAGRPFFGQTVHSAWSYCAYFTNAEARRLFAFIRSREVFRQEFDFDRADTWMRSVEQTGADVWFSAS